MDFFNQYVFGIIQMLTGAYVIAVFLQKRLKSYFYILFAILCMVMIKTIPNGGIIDFAVYVLSLVGVGIVVCHADWKTALLYAALTVEIMQLCYGIVNSLTSILYSLLCSWNRRVLGLLLMLSGNVVSLLLEVFFYYIIHKFFIHAEETKKQYVLMILTPILMLFLMDEYISSAIYENAGDIKDVNHYQMFVIQFLGMASLFCILFAYKKLLQNFRLSTELSLLTQEEHSLNQYVEEVKARYEETKSFRHDIKNHIMVVRELLQNGKSEQALNYIANMEDIAGELSFPCATNNPVVDILIENKLAIAKSMEVDVNCSLTLPYPCLVRDIDFGIILSNALDNAIHACKNMDSDAEKYIRVTGHMQGDFILLEIENSFKGGTFKKGTGLSNITAVAEKYHGAMSIKTLGTSFVLSVLLIISQQSESISQQIG